MKYTFERNQDDKIVLDINTKLNLKCMKEIGLCLILAEISSIVTTIVLWLSPISLISAILTYVFFILILYLHGGRIYRITKLLEERKYTNLHIDTFQIYYCDEKGVYRNIDLSSDEILYWNKDYKKIEINQFGKVTTYYPVNH